MADRLAQIGRVPSAVSPYGTDRILEALSGAQTMAPTTGPGSLTPADWAKVQAILNTAGGAVGNVAQTAGAELYPRLQNTRRELGDAGDYLARTLLGTPPRRTASPVLPSDAPLIGGTASAVPGAPVTPGSVAAARGRGPAVDGMSISKGLTPPQFTPPDFSSVEELLQTLSPGTAPTEPGTREYIHAALGGAAAGLAAGRNLEQGIMLGVAGAFQGRAAEEDEYLARLERFEERAADVALKKTEIESNLALARSNFEMQQQAALQNYQQTKATIQIQEKTLEANQALEWAKLEQPYIGIAENRLIIADRLGRTPPRSFVINELSDAITQAKQLAEMQEALGGGGSIVTIGNEYIKSQIKDQQVTGFLTVGIARAMRDWDTPEVVELRQRAAESILSENPNLQVLRPDVLDKKVFGIVAMQLGLGAAGQAASGRDVPPLETPVEPNESLSQFQRGLLGSPGRMMYDTFK